MHIEWFPDLERNARDRYAYVARAFLSARKGPPLARCYNRARLWWHYYFNKKELIRRFNRTANEAVRSASFVLIDGKTETGQPLGLRELNEWRKGIAHLLEEVEIGEAKLFRNESGLVIRFAENVKVYPRRITPEGVEWLRIVLKVYKKKKDDPITTQELYAVSETRRPGEDSIRTMLMGLLEELHISLTENEIANLQYSLPDNKPALRLSTAYYGVYSHVLSIGIIVTLEHPRPQLEGGADIEDTEVRIRAEWQLEPPEYMPPPGNWKAKNIWVVDGWEVSKELVPAGMKIIESLKPEEQETLAAFEVLDGDMLQNLLKRTVPNGQSA